MGEKSLLLPNLAIDNGHTSDEPPFPQRDLPSEDHESLEHAPVARANWLTAGQLMIADIVGVGILALPSAMVELGWGLGPLLIVLFFPLNVYTGILLWRIRLKRPAAVTYMDMARAVSGPKLAKFSAVMVYFGIWLVLGEYTLVVGESLALIFFDVYICKRDWVFIGALCLLPFIQLRTLNDTRWLCWVNMVTITLTVVVAMGYLIWQGSNETITPGFEPEIVPAALTAFSFATSMSKIAFAYAGQFLYLEIMAEMQQPKDFPKAFILAGPYQVGMYLLSACLGYYYKGQKAQGLVINFIEPNGWLRFAAILLFIHMIITYLIKATVLSRAVHRVFSPKNLNDTSLRGRIEWFFATLAVLLSCIVIANAIPFFDSLTGLIGAISVPIASWLLPITYFWYDKLRKPVGMIENASMILIYILGIFLTIIGTYSNFSDIIDSWEKYGAPFSCIYVADHL